MAVTSLNSSFSDLEGSPSFSSIGGGQGAGINTDVVIEGTQSLGRRSDNVTDHGYLVSVTPAVDMSAAGVHLKAWAWVTHWTVTTAYKIRISDGSNNDDHTFPSAEYPALGGWAPVWIDVSRTPEAGGSVNEASVNGVGVMLSVGDVGGNAPNNILDEILYTAGSGGGNAGLEWTGTGGAMSDFRTFESTNNEGNLVTLGGVDFCYSRLNIGDSAGTATTFTDSGFTVVFPSQALVATDFMGCSIYANNASSSISLSDATFQSSNPAGASRKPDFIVTQNVDNATSFTNLNAIGMRLVQLGQRVLWDGGIIDTVDMIVSNHANTEVKNVVVRTRSAVNVPCLSTQPLFGSTNGIHDSEFSQSGAGHALEINTGTSLTFTNILFSGYASSDGNAGDEAVLVDYPEIIDGFVHNGSFSAELSAAGGDYFGQSFTGDGRAIDGARVRLRRQGTPGGNIVAKIYAHSGTFGSSSLPNTGTTHATSTAVSIDTLSTSDSWVEFTFPTPFTATNATNYFVAFEVDGGYTHSTGVDALWVYYISGANALHSGNMASRISSTWTALATADVDFGLYNTAAANSQVSINISGGDVPSILSTGAAVTVVASVTVTITGLQTGSEVRVWTRDGSGDNDQAVDGIESTTGSTWSFSGQAGQLVNITVYHLNYLPIYIEPYTIPSNNSEVPVQQSTDRIYLNP